MPSSRFEYKDARSSKFWEVTRAGNQLHVRWGRIGSDGQEQTKRFKSEAEARSAAERLSAEKLRKGYVAARAGRGPRAASKPAPKARAAAATHGALETLLQCFAVQRSVARKRLALALSDSAAYLQEFPSCASPQAAVPDALGAGLEAAKAVVSVDWKEDAKTFVSCLEGVRAQCKAPAGLFDWFDLEEWEHTEGSNVLFGAVAPLARKGFTIVDIGTYELTLVRSKHVKALAALAKKIDLDITIYDEVRTGARYQPKKRPKRPGQDAKYTYAKWPLPNGRRAQQRWLSGPLLAWRLGREAPMLLIDLQDWPPRVHELPASKWAMRYAVSRSRDGRLLLLEYGDVITEGKSVRRHRPVILDTPASTPRRMPWLPRYFEDIGWLGDRVVGLHEDTLNVRSAPLLWNGSSYRPAPGLPANAGAKYSEGIFTWYLRQGFAQTGSGADVLLWNDRGWELKGRRLVPTFELGRCGVPQEYPAVPGANDGFFINVTLRPPRRTRGRPERLFELREIRRGRPPVERLARHGSQFFDDMCPGPQGSVLLSTACRNTSSEPIAVGFFPEERSYFDVPAAMFGIKGKDGLEGHFHGIWYVPQADMVAALVYVEGPGRMKYELRAVPWQQLAALPRRDEK